MTRPESDQPGPKSPKPIAHRRCLQHIFSKLPAIWKMVWEHRYAIFQDPLVNCVIVEHVHLGQQVRDEDQWTDVTLQEAFTDLLLADILCNAPYGIYCVSD